METTIYKKHLYLNKAITFAISSEIIEYDISSAGFSLIKQYGLLPQSKIDMLSKLSKHERHIKIGKMQRKDKALSQQLNECFVEARRLFFSHNDLDESNVLSIKKDAIFTINKRCDNCDFGEIHFSEKNVYSSYAFFADCEFYYNNMTGELDIKNIDDAILEKHKDHMIVFIKTMFRHMETSSKETTLRYLRRFIDKYKARELELEYYREFTRISDYNVINRDEGDNIRYDNYWIDEIDNLDISYNYGNIIVPFLRATI